MAGHGFHGGGGVRGGGAASRAFTHAHGGRRRRGGWRPVYVQPEYIVEDYCDDDDDPACDPSQQMAGPLSFLESLFLPGWGAVAIAGVLGVGLGFALGFVVGEGSVGSGIGRAAGSLAEHGSKHLAKKAIPLLLG